MFFSSVFIGAGSELCSVMRPMKLTHLYSYTGPQYLLLQGPTYNTNNQNNSPIRKIKMPHLTIHVNSSIGKYEPDKPLIQYYWIEMVSPIQCCFWEGQTPGSSKTELVCDWNNILVGDLKRFKDCWTRTLERLWKEKQSWNEPNQTHRYCPQDMMWVHLENSKNGRLD